jgi:hypothetical protein
VDVRASKPCPKILGSKSFTLASTTYLMSSSWRLGVTGFCHHFHHPQTKGLRRPVLKLTRTVVRLMTDWIHLRKGWIQVSYYYR